MNSDKKIEEKVDIFFSKKTNNAPIPLYDGYDYDSFWRGRDFENLADQIAISRLIDKIMPPYKKIIDIGAGTGRLSSFYERKWRRIVLLDPSPDQLAVARKRIGNPDKFDLILGTVESIPLPNSSCDAAICIRAFHYVNDPQKAIKEIKRVLAPNGHLILEIPNKRHIKARLRSLFSSSLRNEISSQDPRSIALKDKDTLFVNHHPESIRNALLMEQLEIIDIISVSNFRSSFLKKHISLKALLFFERILQHPLAKIWFGPSIYFLAKKSKTSALK